MGAQPLGFASLQPFGVYPWQAYVQLGDGHQSTPCMHRVAAPSTTFSRGEPSAIQPAVPQPSHLYGGAYSLGGSAESHLFLCLPYMMGRGLLFQVWCHQMTWSTESVMGIKPGDSGVVIGYQVDEFTCTWSAEWFVAHSHIYPGFTGKVSSLTYFPLEPGCEDYAFWTRLLLTLNRAWIPSSLIHLRHQNWTVPWMSLMSLHLQSLLGFSTWLVPFLIILSCSLLLALELINCGARLGLFLPLCLWLPRCQHLN